MNQAQGAQQTDQTANFFWMICIICGVVLILWWLDEKYIVGPIFWLRIHEIDIIRFLAKLWTPIANFFHLTPPNMTQLSEIENYMRTAEPGNVGWENFAAINTALGEWVRYPVIIILLGLAIFVYSQRAVQFHNRYTMKTLREVGKEVWPQITPVMSLDLAKQNIDKGPWAMSQPPLAFCTQHNLLLVKTVANKKVYVLKHKPSYRLFSLQLGPMWKGLDYLPIHVKAITLICLCRATGQRAMAKKILISNCRIRWIRSIRFYRRFR